MLVLIALKNLFSLHARNFEAPDSRPGSGSRLSPLEHVRGFSTPYLTIQIKQERLILLIQ